MSKRASLRLGDHFDTFVETQIGAGRYDTASDVVRAGLWLLEERETQLAALRAALIEGEASGQSTPFDVEAFLADKRTSELVPYVPQNVRYGASDTGDAA